MIETTKVTLVPFYNRNTGSTWKAMKIVNPCVRDIVMDNTPLGFSSRDVSRSITRINHDRAALGLPVFEIVK